MDAIHVLPEWEDHIASFDCWCEPRVQLQPKGRIFIHDARTCSDGSSPHVFDGRLCLHCGQRKPKVSVHFV